MTIDLLFKFRKAVNGMVSVPICWVCGIALPLIYFTNFPRWYDVVTGTRYAPLAYYSVALICLPLAVGSNRKIFPFFKHGYVLLCLVFVAMQCVVWLWLKSQGESLQYDVMFEIIKRTSLAIPFAFVAYHLSKDWTGLWMRVAALVVPVSLMYAFYNPSMFLGADFDSVQASGRVAAMWQNPNIAGEAILLSLALVSGRTSRAALVGIYLLSGIAVILTGSRAAMFGWLILGGLLVYRKNMPIYMLLTPVVLAVLYLPLFNAFEAILLANPDHERGAENLLNRVNFFAGKVDAAEGGGDQRFEIAAEALRATLERPILGYGYGFESSGEERAGPHNQILQMWHFYGVAGLLVWFALVGLLYRVAANFQFLNPHCFCFVWFSFFSHNLLEYNHWFVYFAIIFFLDRNVGGSSSSDGVRRASVSSARIRPRGKRRWKRGATGKLPARWSS